MIHQAELWDEPEIVQGKPVLLDVQRDLLERGRKAYGNGVRRVLFQATCGAGKTVVAAQQTEDCLAKGGTVLHIVHRRRLVDQMIGTQRRFGVVASPIMEGRHRWEARVSCASRDTLLAMLKSGQQLPRATLIVWDEAHVAAREVQDWYLQNCPEAYWTGYTATPVRPDGSSLNPPYQKLVCMAPASKLMAIGRLCPVKVFDPKAVAGKRKRGEPVKPVGHPVDHWKKYALDLPTVAFAANVAQSRELVESYRKAGVTAEHIDASTPEEDREEVFERSRSGQVKVVSNVGVMVEGVDLPWLVCCQILRGCNSLVLYVQACGRVMRSFEGKTHGVVLDHAGAVYDFGLPDSDFQWTLEDASANEKRNKPPKERKPIACMVCGFVFVAKPACPKCGRVLPQKRRKSLLAEILPGDAVLTAHVAGQQSQIKADALDRLWVKCLHIGKAKGWAMRQVAGVFSKEAKVAPWEAGLSHPLPFGKDGWAQPAANWVLAQRA